MEAERLKPLAGSVHDSPISDLIGDTPCCPLLQINIGSGKTRVGGKRASVSKAAWFLKLR